MNATTKAFAQKAIVAILWLLVWHGIYLMVGEELFVVSPLAVLVRVMELAGQNAFWGTIFRSLLRIFLGFSLGAVLGSLVAVLTAHWAWAHHFFLLPMNIIKATPVSSFIFLAVVWMSGRNLSVFISFLMVLPLMWSNVHQGIKSINPQELEMAKVFGLSRVAMVVSIALPAVLPYFLSACQVALGFAWKAGIAGEVIAIPAGTIGTEIYNAKIYLETGNLFAWTAVVVLLSVLIEKLFVGGIRALANRLAHFRTIPIKKNKTQPTDGTLLPPDSTPQLAEDILLEGIHFSYQGKKVFQGFYRLLPVTSRCAFMGDSGRGKTTLLHLVAGLIYPAMGRIQGVQGRRISMVFQEDRLLSHLTVADNLRLVARNLGDAQLLHLFQEVGLAQEANTYPEALSGGMKRRVAIARALAYDGDIFLLDEPFRGLDVGTRAQVADCINRHTQSKTLLLVTHDPEEATLLHAQIVYL